MGSLTEALSIEKSPREVSFSSYLNPSEEAYLRKLVETSKIPNSTITIQKENIYTGKKKAEDGEIGVFGAEKYFNEETTYEQIINQQLKQCPSIVKMQARTPSVHSESSWNSQSGLLQSGRKNSVHTKNAKKRQGMSTFLSTLSCNCSCGDTNSVDIGDQKSEASLKRNFRDTVNLSRTNKLMCNPLIMEEMQLKKTEDLGTELNKKDWFTFPIVYSKSMNLEEEDESKRKSIEVFGSPILEKRKESFFFERKINGFYLDNDYESDSSSDLFEIESFSTINNSNPCLYRQASNVSSCVTPTTCYAPSEASIEWSVVTASVADISFVSNNSVNHAKPSFNIMENTKKATADKKGKEVGKSRSGILFGCKSQKAIEVMEEAYRTTQVSFRHKSAS